MSKTQYTPEEQFREAFIRRVQKECRLQGINCSISYNRIHIYTKYEDFYFDLVPGNIVLMHRNASKNENGFYGYHVQESCVTTRPEGIVRYIANHTKYRYDENGNYRADTVKKTKSPVKVNQEPPKIKQEPVQNNISLTNKEKTAIYLDWSSRLDSDIQKLCEVNGFTYLKPNNCAFINTPYEKFCFEFSRDGIFLRGRKCKQLLTKKAFSTPFPPNVTAETLIEYVKSKMTIKTQQDFVDAFYQQIKKKCDTKLFHCELKGNRVYIETEYSTYYFDIAFNEEIKLFSSLSDEPIITFDEDANCPMIYSAICNHHGLLKQRASAVPSKKKSFDITKWIFIPAATICTTIAILLAIFYFAI